MKRVLTALALVLSSGLLIACGSGSDTATSGAASDGHDDGGHEDTSKVGDGARRIKVTGRSFAFDPSEITAEVGEELAIELSSTDVLHDFTIKEFDAHVSAKKGETKTGGFTADRPGRFTYYCSVSGHRQAGMEGTLIVK